MTHRLNWIVFFLSAVAACRDTEFISTGCRADADCGEGECRLEELMGFGNG